MIMRSSTREKNKRVTTLKSFLHHALYDTNLLSPFDIILRCHEAAFLDFCIIGSYPTQFSAIPVLIDVSHLWQHLALSVHQLCTGVQPLSKVMLAGTKHFHQISRVHRVN